MHVVVQWLAYVQSSDLTPSTLFSLIFKLAAVKPWFSHLPYCCLYCNIASIDVTLFGNDLEIPDEVPAFDPVKRADSPGEVKQTDSPLPPSGGNAGIKKNDGEEVENSHERKYDDLFHEEDGSDAGTMAVKEDYGNAKDYMAALQSKHNNAPTPPPSEHQSGKGSGTNDTTSKTIPNGKIGPKKEEQEVPALVPLAPVAPSAKKAKKTRFKVQVRPKKGGIARKSLKKKK